MKTLEPLIIIGNGMVAAHFCEQFVQLGLGSKYRLMIFGDEPRLAYDRVNLTAYAHRNNFTEIQFHSHQWYDDNHIELFIDEKILSVDTENQQILSDKGRKLSYAKLIFATGSSPFVPKIPGTDLKDVYTYRNCSDVDEIRYISRHKEHAVVIGGGLLGIEAADFLKFQGMETHIIEMADFLMPRQLTPDAANLLKDKIEGKGFTVHTGTSTKAITRTDGKIILQLSDEKTIETDLVVISAGIRPNSKIAAEAGLDCAPRGGILCNDELTTSDPNIFVMGECARHNDTIYGLVAPGYKMAEILAKRLAGEDITFTGADTSTRLKMLGEQVISIGAALQPYPSHTYSDANHYRMLVQHNMKLIGAIGIGDWEESGQIQAAVQNNMQLTDKELKTFEKTGRLWEEAPELEKWPDSTIICNCRQVTKGEIIRCYKACNDLTKVQDQTGAGSVCGSCQPTVAKLCGQNIQLRQKPSIGMMVFSSLCLITLLVICYSPVFWNIDSYNSDRYRISEFLRSFLMRQVTGYTVLFFGILAALIGVRKRWKRFSFGKFSKWRISHAVFALLSLIAVIFHTGFSSGKNLNSWLFYSFISMNFFGVITGFTASFEFFGTNRLSAFCRRWRPQMTFIHLLIFWPLPALLVFHIIQAYFFTS